MKSLAIPGFVLLVAVVANVQRAGAQDEPLYVGVSGMLSTQGSEPPGQSPDLPRTGIGGTAFGISGEFGGFLTRRLSLSCEVSVPARFESVQETDYSIVFRADNQHRDLLFSGLFHVHYPAGRRITVAGVGGPTVVREDTLQRTAYRLYSPSSVPTGLFGPYGSAIAIARWSVGITAGLDVAVQLDRRVQLQSQIRVHWIDRATMLTQNEQESALLGLSAVVIRPAVGVRIGF